MFLAPLVFPRLLSPVYEGGLALLKLIDDGLGVLFRETLVFLKLGGERLDHEDEGVSSLVREVDSAKDLAGSVVGSMGVMNGSPFVARWGRMHRTRSRGCRS